MTDDRRKTQQYMFDALDNNKEHASDLAMMSDQPINKDKEVVRPTAISVIVKGSLAEASHEANIRGVYIFKGNLLASTYSRGDLLNASSAESILWTDDRYLAELSAWFADTPELIPGVGYPDGTCLIYSFHPEVTL